MRKIEYDKQQQELIYEQSSWINKLKIGSIGLIILLFVCLGFGLYQFDKNKQQIIMGSNDVKSTRSSINETYNEISIANTYEKGGKTVVTAYKHPIVNKDLFNRTLYLNPNASRIDEIALILYTEKVITLNTVLNNNYGNFSRTDQLTLEAQKLRDWLCGYRLDTSSDEIYKQIEELKNKDYIEN